MMAENKKGIDFPAHLKDDTMMHVPPGFTEEEVLDAINKALNSLVSNFSFGYFDTDDMRQEGFIFACEALPKFDVSNPRNCGLSNFLRIHIRNRFLNLRRDKLHRNSSPCISCFFKSNQECSEFADINECSKWFGWSTRNKAKRSLVESCDTSKITSLLPSRSHDVCSELFRKELLSHLSSKIPLEFRADYRRMLDGARLTKVRREVVLDIIREILGEMNYGDEEEEGKT